MRALVVYDSVYGNTEKIARAIAAGIALFGEVKVLRASETNLSELEFIELLVVGSPVQGGRPTQADQALLKNIPVNALGNTSVAAFDTRMTSRFAKLFGYAAERIANGLKEKGAHLVALPEGFVVEGGEGPLREGELERVAGWAKGIVEAQKSRAATG
jgi:flavodoxin